MGTLGTLDRFREKYKNSGQGSKSAETKSKGTLDQFREKYGKALSSSATSTADTAYRNYMADYQKFASTAANDSKSVSYGNALANLESRTGTAKDLRDRASKLAMHFHANKDTMTGDAYETAISNIEATEKEIGRIMDHFGDSARYYSQWDTEEDYNAFVAGQEEYQKKLGTDTSALEQELSDLKAVQAEYNELKKKVQTLAPSQSASESARMGEIYKQYGDLDALIAQKQAYLTNVKRLQEGVRLAGVADPESQYYDPDFASKTGYVSTESSGWGKLTSQYGMGYGDLIYEYINGAKNGMRGKILSKNAAFSADTGSETADTWKNYDHMTEDEISIYNYYYNQGGKEAADKYLDSIQETLNYRSAQERYGKLEGNTGLELLFGVEAGLDQFSSGVKSLFSDGYAATSDTQILSGMVREDLKDEGLKLPEWLGGASLGQTGYDAVTTTANMAPSILASMAVGSVSKTAGTYVGNALLGASAAGNAYQEKLNLGYTKEQAGAYGLMIGVSEVILEKALGGISKLGGGNLTKVATQNLGKVDNVLARFAKSAGGKVLMNAGSEALEEGLQAVLEPYLWQAVSGEEAGVEWEEALYSTLLGFITGGIFEGGEVVAGTAAGRMQNNAQAQQLYGESQQELVEEALEIDPGNAFAKKMQGKVDSGKNLSGRQLNKLVQQNEAAIKQGKTGTEGTQQPQASVENTAVTSQRTSAEAANTVDEDTFTPVEKTAPEGGYEVSEDGKTYLKSSGEAVNIAGVSTIEDGKMTLKLEDGRTVDVKEVEYGSADEAVVYETVANMGVNALAANMLIENYTPGGNMSAVVYAKGIEEAYMAGTLNIPQRELLDTPFASQLAMHQQWAAYNLGKLFGGKQVAKEQATIRKNRNVVGVDASKGKVHFDGDRSNLNETQKASLDAMDMLAKALGVQIYVFESKIDENGKRTGANGWYDPSDGSIHIDLYAGADGKGAMLFTVAHELTHFVRQWSPAKFKVLANFLMKQYGEQGVSVRELVQNQIDKAKRNGWELSFEEAYEEMVADSMEAMLTDGNVVQMMADLRQQDKGLWQKIRDWFKDLAGKLRAVVDTYKGVRPDSAEGKLVAEMQDVIVMLESLYADALVDASENYNAGAQKNTTAESGVKYSDGRYLAQITENMTDTQRTEVLQTKSIVAPVYTGEADAFIESESDLVSGRSGLVKAALVRIGEEFHVFTDYDIEDVDVRITLSRGNLRESATKEANPVQLAKLLPILKDTVENAVGIESHANRYFYDNTTESFDNLLGGYIDGEYFVPVRFGLKRIKGGEVVLYVVVDQQKIKAEVLKTTTQQNDGSAVSRSAFTYNVPQLVSLVNSKDLLRYLPDNMLSAEQKKIKQEGIAETIKYTNDKNDAKYVKFIASGNIQAAQAMVDSAAKAAGYIIKAYHGTTNKEEHRTWNVARREWDTSYTPITVFRKQYDEQAGHFFSSDEDNAGGYGSYLYSVYLMMKKPLVIDCDGQSYSSISHNGMEMDTYEWADYARKHGYDGVIFRNVRDGVDYGAMSTPTTDYVVFESNRIKSADPITYDNDGNVIPISERFKVTKRDIRYSNRDPDYQKVNKVLEQENQKLKEDVSYLKELVKIQRTVTGGAKLTRTSVEGAARYLKQNANAKGDTKEFAGLLNSLYEYIASGKELTWEDVKEQAQPAVEWLQDHVDLKSKRSEYAQDILNQIHGSRVYLDESQMAEAAYRFGSYNDFRKQMMGSITFAKDADTSLDTLWQQMADLYPDVFDSETTSTDMPGALADIIDRLRNSDTTALEYARNREMIAQDLFHQVYDSYWRVSTLYTVADVKQREINRLKGEHFQRMAKLREYHREKTAQLKQEHKERLEKVRQDYRDRADAKVRKIVEKHQESRQKGIEGRRKTEMRHKIQKVVKKLNDLLLHESKERHVPDSMKKAVAEALDAINMDTVGADERIAKYDALIAKETDPDVIASLTETRDRIAKSGERLSDRIGKLKAAYDSIKTGADSASISVYDEVIANKIQEVVEMVGNTALRDMSYEQLEAVHEMYTMVAKSISNANRAFKDARGATITQMGTSAIREVKAAGGNNQYALKALEGTKKFGWDLLKPYYAFSFIGSDTLSKLYDNVRKGEDVWATDVESARQFFRQQADKHGYDDWDISEEHTFTDVSGREFKVSLQQIMSLYAYSKRAQADKHLEKGGFVFDSAVEVVQKKHGVPMKYRVNTADAYNLNRLQINEIVDTLSEDQIAFVDAMQDYLSTVMGEKGNEVSLALYDVRLFKEKNYFPLKSASQYTFQQTENTGDVKLKNSGFSKKTVVNASNPIILSDFMSVWGSHVNDMSMYHAFVLPLEDFNRVYNYKTLTSEETSTQSVKAALQNAYGVASTKYIKQMLEDINGGARADDRAGRMSRWIGKFKKGSVFANASVVIQQPSAIARAMALIESQYFIGSKVTQKRHKQLWEEVKRYAPVAIIKEMGYFDTNMGLSASEYITAKNYSTIGERAKAMFTDGNYRDELMSRPAALADELSWCYIWEAVKRETRGKNPGMDMGSEAFLKKAGERFTEVVTRTQVYDSVLSRSGMMRSKDTGVKMMTAFMAEPTTSMNMVFDALVQGKRGNRWYTRSAIGAVIASQILNSLLVSIVYAARDDDEEKTYLEKYLANFVAKTLDSLNPLSYLPFIKDIISIARGYTVERSDMSVISDIWTAWQKLPDENISLYRKIEDFGGSIAQAFGLPAKNIMRDIRAIWQTAKSFLSGPETTAMGIGVAIQEEVTGDSVPKHKQLYDAMVKGDAGHQERIAVTYGDESALESAIRKGLREFDARISEAAEARYYGDFEEYERIFNEIEQEGHFSHSQIAGAVQAEINDMDEPDNGTATPKKYGMYGIEDFMLAAIVGDSSAMENIRAEILRTAQESGKSEEQAQDSFVSSAVSACKEQWLDGKITEKQAANVLVKHCGKSESNAQANISYWTFKQEHPDDEVSAQWFNTYYEKVESSGMDVDTYVEYRSQKAAYTRKTDILGVIDGMPISSKQKDALYFAEGWAESTLDEAPWH